MTKIAVLCDGTWNSPDMVEPTSVVKLRDALVNDFNAGQLVAYFPGIGTTTTDKSDSGVKSWLNKYGGGAFGWGLDAKVKQAYQFLCMAYQPGDEIYLFGFSRGAYTARSVAGMIRKCGLVTDYSTDGINTAFALYRKSGPANKPDEPHIQAERKALSPRFATSPKDLEFRGDDGSEIVNVAYVGVFDTVGARGIPTALFGPVASLWNSQYKFHDAQLSSLVKSARHAIAVDERRLFYVPARWNNVDILNAGDTSAKRPFQQKWFVGNHGIVGGSTAPFGLSVLPLEWVVQGSGLQLKPGSEPDLGQADPLSESPDIRKRGGLLNRWRGGPLSGDSVHVSVQERVKGRSDYRPGSMKASIKAWLAG